MPSRVVFECVGTHTFTRPFDRVCIIGFLRFGFDLEIDDDDTCAILYRVD